MHEDPLSFGSYPGGEGAADYCRDDVYRLSYCAFSLADRLFAKVGVCAIQWAP